jgi:hypothetical protein
MDDTDLKAALELMEELVDAFSLDLNASDRADGWTDEDRLYFLDYFLKLRAQINEGNSTSPYNLEYINISRMLDDRGIAKGNLLHQAARLSNMIRDHYVEWFGLPRKV